MARTPKFTKEQIEAALNECQGNLTRAAALLDVSPSTIHRSMQRYGIQIVIERRAVSAAG